MFKFFRRLFWPKPPAPFDKFDEHLFERLQTGCPSCLNNAMWMQGPAGGACVNIYCGHCGEGYNISEIVGVAQKIGKDERYIAPYIKRRPF